jgi:hypothetical protein
MRSQSSRIRLVLLTEDHKAGAKAKIAWLFLFMLRGSKHRFEVAEKVLRRAAVRVLETSLPDVQERFDPLGYCRIDGDLVSVSVPGAEDALHTT